ncbi:MAG: hypothetical protein V8Q57_01485 [Blautia sp.]
MEIAVHKGLQLDGKPYPGKRGLLPTESLIQEERMTRRAETDAIKEFVEYAKEQGSTHADHYYSNCTRLAYKTVWITEVATAA